MIANYDCIINYHAKKANILTDALSRNSSSLISNLKVLYLPLLIDLRPLINNNHIREKQDQDPKLIKIKKNVKNGLRTDFSLRDDDTLVMGSKVRVLNNPNLKNHILE